MAQEIIEVTPLVGNAIAKPLHNSFVYTVLKNTSLIALWYFFSTALNLINKQLVGRGGLGGKEKFPAPLLMTGVQFFFQFLLCRAFLDSGLVQRTEQQTEVKTWKNYSLTVVPNGVSTGLDIGFSNLSLRTISLSFYTMCKSTTPMFLLLFAFVWHLERPSWSLAGVMVMITSGVLLLVYGETKFNFIGFLLVMSASCLSGLRWTLTQVFLQGPDKHHQEGKEGGPLELLVKLTPIMSGVVLFVSLCIEKWHTLHKSFYFSDLNHTLLTFAIIFATGVLAFLMVWTEFQVIKGTSALTLLVAGTCKEIVTVVAAVIVFHDEFGVINGFGLGVVLFGVTLYNIHRYHKLKKGEARFQHSQAPNGSSLHRDSELEMADTKINSDDPKQQQAS